MPQPGAPNSAAPRSAPASTPAQQPAPQQKLRADQRTGFHPHELIGPLEVQVRFGICNKQARRLVMEVRRIHGIKPGWPVQVCQFNAQHRRQNYQFPLAPPEGIRTYNPTALIDYRDVMEVFGVTRTPALMRMREVRRAYDLAVTARVTVAQFNTVFADRNQQFLLNDPTPAPCGPSKA